MADPPRNGGTEEDAGLVPDRGVAKSTPRWVPVLGIIIVIALIGLMILLHLTGVLGPGTH